MSPLAIAILLGILSSAFVFFALGRRMGKVFTVAIGGATVFLALLAFINVISEEVFELPASFLLGVLITWLLASLRRESK